MENKTEKCKFCGSEEKLVVSMSKDENGNNYQDGYECIECSIKRKNGELSLDNKIPKFCINCVGELKDKCHIFHAGEIFWEGEYKKHSAFFCSKCNKEFDVGEIMFIPKNHNKES